MCDYTLFKDWKNSHATEMQDLTFARPDDIFIFTRFTLPLPCCFEGKQVLYAGDIKEAAGYIRHIFLYDILNDMTDDLAFDPKLLNENEKCAELLMKFCKEFNKEFNHRTGSEYELQVLKGADELRKFLNLHCKGNPNFDKKRLSNLCSSDLFAGRPLKDFLDNLFL